MVSFKKLLSTSLMTLGLSAVGLSTAFAQSDFPNKPIRLVVPFAPGGVTDTSARIVAEHMGKRLGKQMIVDNRPGASGNIGTGQVVRADPDGYTLLLGFDGTMVINPHVFANIPFDTLKDFAPVGKIGDAILIMVAHPSVQANNLNEVIALSKKTPGGLSYGTSGPGSTPHIMGESLNVRTGSNLVHVAYKGGGPAMIDLQGGNIPIVITAVAGALPHIQAGRIKGIGVSSAQRASSLPDLPTFIEQGQKDFILNSWVGILAPQKTPAPIIDKLNTTLNEVLRDPEVVERLQKLGVTPMPGTPAQFGAALKADLEEFGKVVKAAKISQN
ncbi:Bug family tripartite tricarboxylate transporter substrate binding protein [Zwartia vadi]|uniref:Bug family tripartite tricarboxylate transporter substrate binding protein n=1 Tax=Zwartia vadi TaxID=3058168 RepID=UPI0025B3F885|nr:tripartite tricarboxylate transporter substrate binding protein [Zwartia vadi]MDN3987568.1 tripartite tricarboxylate transporter substrate binding protein [Zwartia vadi]